jgi:hypothetical protein
MRILQRFIFETILSPVPHPRPLSLKKREGCLNPAIFSNITQPDRTRYVHLTKINNRI